MESQWQDQEPVLFQDTIYENIAAGSANSVTKADVEQAIPQEFCVIAPVAQNAACMCLMPMRFSARARFCSVDSLTVRLSLPSVRDFQRSAKAMRELSRPPFVESFALREQ